MNNSELYLKDLPSSVHVINKYYKNIEKAPFYNAYLKKLQELVALKELNLETFNDSIVYSLQQCGFENELKNDIYYWIRERNRLYNGVHCRMEKEPMHYLQQAQIQWENRIYKSVNSLSAKLSVPLSIFRDVSDQTEIVEKWNMLSTYSLDVSEYRPVYAPKDFLDVLLNIRNPNHSGFSDKWNLGTISIKVSSLVDLREKYNDLVNSGPLLGTHNQTTQSFSDFENIRIKLGENVLKKNDAKTAQEFVKYTSPHCIRSKIWALLLGSNIFPWHTEYYKKLKDSVVQYDMLVDKLSFKDVQITVCNDDQYFVFEDLLYQVALIFSRDIEVANKYRCNFSSSNPMIGILKGKSNYLENTICYPPNGVLPFYGFSMFVAPLAYVFTDTTQLYFTFRSFYLRYWCRLHEVSSHHQGILSLCILFQSLLDENEMVLSQHFSSTGVQPGYLPPLQLLLLWDLILGYDSLEIIPLLALAILCFRKEHIFQVDNQQDMEAILADLTSIQIIPLLQCAIFSE